MGGWQRYDVRCGIVRIEASTVHLVEVGVERSEVFSKRCCTRSDALAAIRRAIRQSNGKDMRGVEFLTIRSDGASEVVKAEDVMRAR